MSRPTTLALPCAALLCAGCYLWPARVDLYAYDHEVHELPAAGLYDLTYGVEAVDAREIDDRRDLGRRRGTLVYKPRVLARQDPARVAAGGVVAELRRYDLEVVHRSEADVVLRVILERFSVQSLRPAHPFEMEGGQLRAVIEALVEVVDGQSGRVVAGVPIATEGEAGSMLLSARYYEYALADALTEFSARAVRHPDVLIAIQAIHPTLRRDD